MQVRILFFRADGLMVHEALSREAGRYTGRHQIVVLYCTRYTRRPET